ncbi:Iron/ascorbate family oxidoreductase [Handroanthus impetiginosus]|uniref:Iron/ascorbate family oxidoreductase n=1 Tax=Handroanthus impetiginosus TaxID=429701 RepID=A0A2G9HQG9_9LAMI|nr:Iron/ascorbate family oxidoreductase [Handroanthus impetiginosus]
MENTKKVNYHESKFINQNGIQQTIMIPVVQDLAELKTLPENFIQNPAATHPFPPNASFEPIDMVKIQSREIRKLGRVCEDWGMFIIENHGLDPRLLHDRRGRAAEVVKRFFELPFEEKKSSVGTYTSADNMGYGRNFVKSEDQPLDWIDRLAMKAAPEGASDGLCVWPTNPPNFRSVIEKYVKATRKLMNELLQALAKAISLDKQSFSQYFNPNTSEINVRVNYYPPCPRPDLALGITPHTDASALTLLMQFESSNGLQVFKDDHWLTVPWPCNTLLVNLGDLMEIMSNGRLKSPWHRVMTQSEMGRSLIALFYNPPAQVEIGPVKGEEAMEEYKKVVVKEYLKHFYKVSPTASKVAIMYAKVN